MSLGAGIREFLSDRMSVDVFPVMLPQGAALPALTYQLIAPTHLNSHSTSQEHPVRDELPVVTSRIQFNQYGATYDECEALDRELLRACVGFRGWWGEVWIGGVVADLALDDYEPGPNHWRRVRDLLIKHRGDIDLGSS